MRLIFLLSIFLSIALSTAAVADDLLYPLVNPSFESPVLTPENSYSTQVDGWQTIGGIGVTLAQEFVPGYPGTDGNQFVFADSDGFNLFQEAGLITSDTLYTFSVDLFPLSAESEALSAEVLIEESTDFVAILAQQAYQPPWAPEQRDFELTPGVWTTVQVAFNGSAFPDLLGNQLRVRIAGNRLAIDNARLTVSGTRDARDFYVSSSQGDDSNPGTEAAPWETFSPFDTRLLVPGDRVLLKRGDSWTAPLSVEGKGSADAPVTLTAYGEGPKPRIVPGNLYDGRCIVIEGAHHWRISNLQGEDAKIGLYLRYENNFANEDVLVEDCDFKNMSDPTFDPALFNYELAWSSGIFVGGKVFAGNDFLTVLDGLTVRRCTFENCAAGFFTNWFFPEVYKSRLKNVVLEDCLATEVLTGGMVLNLIDGGHARRFRTIGRAANAAAISTGTTGGFMQSCKNFVIDECEIADTARPPDSADGSGFDFEGDSENIQMTNMVIHDNDGPAILMLSTIGPNQDITIENSTFYNNGLDAFELFGPNNVELKAGENSNGTGILRNLGLYRAPTSVTWISQNWGGFSREGIREREYTAVENLPTRWDFDTPGDF